MDSLCREWVQSEWEFKEADKNLWIIVMFLSAVLSLILMAPNHCRGFIGEQVI